LLFDAPTKKSHTEMLSCFFSHFSASWHDVPGTHTILSDRRKRALSSL
jgi:hypothetical protein